MKTLNLYGYFGFKNVGDDLMLINFLDYINLHCTEKMEVRVFCHKDYYIFKKYTKVKVNVIELNIVTNHFLMPYYIFSSFCGYWIGGTCLYEPDDKDNSGLIWLYKLVKKYKKYKKEFLFINIGIGSLYSIKAKYLASKILSAAERISFREQSSLIKSEQLENSTKGILGGDMVFLNSKSFSRLDDISSKNYLGFAGHSQYKNNISTIDFYANLLNNISKYYDKVIFISMHGSEDHEFHRKIVEKINIDYLFIEYKEHLELFQKMKELKFLIGMRLHSVVLADLLAIPNIGVAYGEKVSHYIKKSTMLATIRTKKVNENITIEEINNIIDKYYYNSEFIINEANISEVGIKNILKRV